MTREESLSEEIRHLEKCLEEAKLQCATSEERRVTAEKFEYRWRLFVFFIGAMALASAWASYCHTPHATVCEKINDAENK